MSKKLNAWHPKELIAISIMLIFLHFMFYFQYERRSIVFTLTVVCAKVGGELSTAVIRQMNRSGRICVCGSMSSYNSDGNMKGRFKTWFYLSNCLLPASILIYEFVLYSRHYSTEHVTEMSENGRDIYIFCNGQVR